MTKRKRRKYTKEFKEEAVKLVTEQGYKISEAARSLGIHENMLGKWKSEFSDSSLNSLSGDSAAALKAELTPIRLINMNKLVFFIIIFLPSIIFADQNMVINGYPSSVVHSSSKNTQREEITNLKKKEYQLVIKKINGEYYWVSRNNKKLYYSVSGVIHIFTEINGSGYITVYDPSILSKKFRHSDSIEYKEHIRNFNSNITYWGTAEIFRP